MNVIEQKAALRDFMRAKRKAITSEDRRIDEAALENRLLNLPALKHAKCIALYNPVGSEARFVSDFDMLFTLEQHPVIAFPVVDTKTLMHFSAFEIDDDLSVLENPLKPANGIDHERAVLSKDIDLILVPGLAFDARGHRLGQGGGYYDRFLPLVRKDCLIVGVAFDEQIVEEVPCESSDCRVDYIITPSRIITAEK